MNRRGFIETTGAMVIACGSLTIAGCLGEEESDGLIITEGTATTEHEEREVILSGTVKNEAHEERFGTVVGEVTIRETDEVFTESKDVTLEGHESTRFELRIIVESPTDRLNYSYRISVAN